MKLVTHDTEVTLSDDTVPHRLLGGPASIAIEHLGKADPDVLVFPGSHRNRTTLAVDYGGLESELTGFIRLTGFQYGIVPDLTNLRRVDGNPLDSTDFREIVESLVDNGFITFATKVTRATFELDDGDVWPVPVEEIDTTLGDLLH